MALVPCCLLTLGALGRWAACLGHLHLSLGLGPPPQADLAVCVAQWGCCEGPVSQCDILAIRLITVGFRSDGIKENVTNCCLKGFNVITIKKTVPAEKQNSRLFLVFEHVFSVSAFYATQSFKKLTKSTKFQTQK